MPSLNQLSEHICGLLDQPNNIPLREQVKFSVKHYRASLIRRDVERNGLSHHYIQAFNVKLIAFDKADTCVASLDCQVLRTENKLPRSIRMKRGGIPFKYFGAIGGIESYTFTELSELTFTFHNKYTANIKRYDIINDYGYIFNTNKVGVVRIEDIFSNPEEAIDFCDDTACYTDDMEFPLPEDMIQTIVEGIIKGEFRLIPTDQQVKINIDENKGR